MSNDSHKEIWRNVIKKMMGKEIDEYIINDYNKEYGYSPTKEEKPKEPDWGAFDD